MEEKIQELKENLKDSQAYAAIIFGSYARNEEFNDIDVAVFTQTGVENLVKKSESIFDIQRFSELPMNIRHRVLKEGELIYCSDEDKFYDETIRFAREYESFRPKYREYLEGVKTRG